VTGTFTYQALSDSLSTRLGSWADFLFAFGLFAAGFSSAVTAPLAAALTARSLLGGSEDKRWDDRSSNYRFVWGGVLLTGLVFGLTGVKPIPAIIIAQALNGILLPLVAVLLLFIMNDRNGTVVSALNRAWNNVIMVLIVGISIFLGSSGVLRSVISGLGLTLSASLIMMISIIVAVFALIPTVYHIRQLRR
jgi:Mn2+/Fe2+ NRAMP family transporter